MSFNSFRPRAGWSFGVLLICINAAAHAEDAPSPRYTYLGAGYEWTDVKYAIKALPDNKIDGYSIEGSLGILNWLHVAGEYFDGDFEFQNSDIDGFNFGIGVNFGIADSWDLVGRISFVDVEVAGQNPGGGTSFALDDDGYLFEGMVRGKVSDRTEINVGYAYTDLDASGNSNSDVTVGILFDVTNFAALHGRGVVFGNDTGLELGVRFYLGDSLF